MMTINEAISGSIGLVLLSLLLGVVTVLVAAYQGLTYPWEISPLVDIALRLCVGLLGVGVVVLVVAVIAKAIRWLL
jgi:hypothetical protein